MEENKENEVLLKNKVKKVHKFRDTVLIRVERCVKDEVKGLSKERGWTMSWICSDALRGYLESLKSID